MRAVAIIPARGGSRGIPRKNLIDFCGHPLLSWTIAAARRCSQIETVFVSTDDAEITEVARQYGAEIIARPPEISGDTASSESALIHALETIQKDDPSVDTVVFLQATSPLRETSELEGALRRFKDHSVDSLFSASQPEDMLMWLRDNSGLQSLNYDYRSRKRRQDVHQGQEVLIETGSFYITRADILLAGGNRLGGRIDIWPVPFWKSFEIDSMESLEVCSTLMRAHRLDVVPPEKVRR